MKHRTNDEQKGYSWDRPEQQPVDQEILRSVERPNISAVFGTSSPPGGLSGVIRRSAYKQSENGYGRWLPLILADRIDAIEGIIDDLRHGHFPNIFAEKGYKAMWKHDKAGLVVSLATTAVVTATVLTILFRRRSGGRDRRSSHWT